MKAASFTPRRLQLALIALPMALGIVFFTAIAADRYVSESIVSVNAAWREFAHANAAVMQGCGIGSSYLDACDRVEGEDKAQAQQMAAGIRSVLAGTTPRFVAEYACHSPTEQRWFGWLDYSTDLALVVHGPYEHAPAAAQ